MHTNLCVKQSHPDRTQALIPALCAFLSDMKFYLSRSKGFVPAPDFGSPAVAVGHTQLGGRFTNHATGFEILEFLFVGALAHI